MKYVMRSTFFLLTFLAFTWYAIAQANSDYGLIWWTVDGSGTTFSSSGSYTLATTVGQPDAGSLSLTLYKIGDLAQNARFWGIFRQIRRCI